MDWGNKMILLFSGGIDSFVAYHYLGKPKTVYFDLGTPYTGKEIKVITCHLGNGASIAAVKYGMVVGNMLGGVSTELVRSIIGGFLLFIGILIVGGIVNIILNKFIKISGFIVFDKALGAGFGILRSVIILLLIIPLVTNICAEKTWWQESILIPKLQALAEQVRTNLPKDWIKSYTDLTEKLGA